MSIKPRIQYVVDDAQLKQLIKDLKEVDKKTDDINENQPDLSPGAKKSSSALADLKTTIGGLGIAAAIGAATIEFAKLTQEVNKNRKEVALLTGETGRSLDEVTDRKSVV